MQERVSLAYTIEDVVVCIPYLSHYASSALLLKTVQMALVKRLLLNGRVTVILYSCYIFLLILQ